MAGTINALRLNDAADQRYDKCAVASSVLAQVDCNFSWICSGNLVVKTLGKVSQCFVRTIADFVDLYVKKVSEVFKVERHIDFTKPHGVRTRRRIARIDPFLTRVEER